MSKLNATNPTMMAPATSRLALVDRLGALASTACATHCLMVALLPAALAASGLSAALGEQVEWGLVIAAAVLACVAMVASWRRHQAFAPALAFAAGVPPLLAARSMEEAGLHGLGTAMGVGASALLVLGHGLSLRRSRRSRGCDDPCRAPG